MSNKEIISQIKRLVKLMELHGENDFKIRTYQNAIQRLERVNFDLSSMAQEELTAIDGIGKSIAALVDEISSESISSELRDLESNTPKGLLELLNFRGIGTKKLALVWQEFGVTDKADFRQLLDSGKLLSVKGFGQKTISTLSEIIAFAFESEGKIYYAEAEEIGKEIIRHFDSVLPEARLSFVGKLRRKWEVISSVELLIDQPLPKIMPVLNDINWLEQDKKKSGPFTWKGITTTDPIVEIAIYPSTKEKFTRDLMLKTGSPEHLNSEIGENRLSDLIKATDAVTEKAFYKEAGLAYCPPEIREGNWEIEAAKGDKLPVLLEMADLKGILHNHTNYSDGQNSLTEMAEACLEMGYEYVGITDHSKAASFYANGLFEERVFQQQEEIDALNNKMAPFKIFKGIEADILADGALDYDAKTLASFDFVVASIHSGLSMDKNKATERLITAIANPYTTILGHMTGRILLQRIGYPVDHEAIINACAEFGVVIEINAHPKRLDIDWRWVRMALDKGVMLSINPDAHEIIGYHDMYYGVCVGRKGGLRKEQTMNAMSLTELSNYFEERKKKIADKV
jgi:DNA polymerase (family 10)